MCQQPLVSSDLDKPIGVARAERQQALPLPLVAADEPGPFARHVFELVARLDEATGRLGVVDRRRGGGRSTVRFSDAF